MGGKDGGLEGAWVGNLDGVGSGGRERVGVGVVGAGSKLMGEQVGVHKREKWKEVTKSFLF